MEKLVERMKRNRLAKLALCYKPTGKRNKRLPPQRNGKTNSSMRLDGA
jgi:hypothetical protein